MHSQEKARDQDEGQSHIVVHGKRRMIRTKGQSLALVLVKKTKGQSLTFVRGRRSDEGAEPHTRSLQKARRRGRASHSFAAEGAINGQSHIVVHGRRREIKMYGA